MNHRFTYPIIALAAAQCLSSTLSAQSTTTNAPAQLEDVLVLGEQETTFVAREAQTATKMDVPLIETPQSVQIIPEAVLESQQSRTLVEALRNVSGVSDSGSAIGFDRYRIRGFDASGYTFQDGLLLDQLFWAQPEITSLESVEVVKGPASVLYGQIAPGGLVNMVSKRPKFDAAHYDFDFTLGNYSFYEPRFDIGGPIGDGQSLAYRVNGLYRTEESFIDFVERERFFVAPSLSWRIGENTDITFLTSFSWDDQVLPQGLPAAGTVLPNVNGKLPHSRYIGEPSNRDDIFQGQVGYQLEHRFNDDWKLVQSVRGTYTDVDSAGTFPGSLGVDQRTLSRFWIETLAEYYTVGADTRLQGNITTGPAEHTLIGGVDIQYRDIDMDSQFGSIGSLDVFAPVYGSVPTGLSPSKWLVQDFAVGGYLQDQVRLWEKLTLLAGVRFDHAETEMSFPPGAPTEQEDFEVSPRAGILYQVTPNIAPYFSYAQSFLPINFGQKAPGVPLDPETGEQFEFGVKADAFEGRLTSTLSFYHLTQQNVAVSDPLNPGFSTQTGEQRSQGIELDAALNIVGGLNLIGAYAYNDIEITEDTDPTVIGNRPNNVPEHSGSLWLTYELQDGPLKGLGAGVGGRFVDKREGDFANTFTIPSYATVDAALFYRRNQFRAQLNIKNVLDKEYYASSFNSDRVIPGEPIMVRASVGWSF